MLAGGEHDVDLQRAQQPRCLYTCWMSTLMHRASRIAWDGGGRVDVEQMTWSRVHCHRSVRVRVSVLASNDGSTKDGGVVRTRADGWNDAG